MRVFRGQPPASARGVARALTIGNFDGVHRGHQAMLALLVSEARHRGLPACVLSFEPHPRDYFARLSESGSAGPGAPSGGAVPAPARIATLRDKLGELERCGIDEVVVARFDRRFAAQSPQAFIDDVLRAQLGVRYVLVGDDFRFGAKRAGTYDLLDKAGSAAGFDVARMMSYEVHGQRVSSSAVREALARGDLERTAGLLGRPYSISGRVIRGQQLGRTLGFRTLNIRFPHPRPAAMGIFVVQVYGLAGAPLPGVASLGVRPTVDDSGRVLLETHCFEWPLEAEAGYGRCVRVELLAKLHDERRYETLDALREGIEQDSADAKDWFRTARPDLR